MEFLQLFFSVPAVPDLGPFAKVTGLAEKVAEAMELAYFEGANDGLVWGFIASFVLVFIFPKLDIVRKINNALDS